MNFVHSDNQASINPKGQLSTVAMRGEQWDGAIFDYQEFVAWLTEQLEQTRLTRAFQLVIDQQYASSYALINQDLLCLFLRDTPIQTARFRADGFLVFRLVLKGEMLQQLDQEPKELSGLEASFLSTKDSSAGWMSATESEEGVTGIVIFCRGRLLQQHFENMGGISETAAQRFVPEPDICYSRSQIPPSYRMLELGKQLIDLDLDRDPGLITCEGVALQLLSEFVNALIGDDSSLHGATELSRRDVDLLNSARAYLAENYDKRITIKQLAKNIGLNRTKLNQGFGIMFGTTIHQYVVKQRMEKAAGLLMEDVSLEHIAGSVGYGSSASFCRAFKQFFGCSPRAYHQANQR